MDAQTEIDIERVNQLANQAEVELELSNWSGARLYLLRAMPLIGGIPDSEVAREKLRFDRAALQSLIDQIADEERREGGASGTGMQFSTTPTQNT